MDSVWKQTSERTRFNKLNGNLKTDVLIIGGGMCGILCAYMLAQAGVDYALVEAGTVCGGVTGNTTAKITFQHGLVYGDLINKFGIERARQYLDANKAALLKFRELCKNIDCDFEDKPSYVYSVSNRKKTEKELAALDKLGYAAEFSDALPLPFAVAGAVKFNNQAQFHPLKFIAAISAKLNIFENTKILELIGTKAVTDDGAIDAEKIIVATHFPFINKHGGYFIKLYQHRSYIIALSDAAEVNGMYVDEAEKGMSFRNYGKLLLIGGGGHRTGKKGGGWRELSDFAKLAYPSAAEEYRWAAQDCMSLDGVPYIGPYSAGTDGLYVAAGFNKWGMTSSMAAATLLTDMALGRDNPYARVFLPYRSAFHPQLAANVIESVAGLLTPSAKRCPHLGCALKWNPDERSWDCPCHGSRFTRNGGLIDNPATDDLKK